MRDPGGNPADDSFDVGNNARSEFKASGASDRAARNSKSGRIWERSGTMPLEIKIRQSPGTLKAGATTVALGGSLDTSTAPELERQILPVLNGHVTNLIFDLAELKFISSAGLRIFGAARKRLKERAGQVSFVNMQPQIRNVFEIMESLPGVAVFQNTAELDAYLAARQQIVEENNK